MAQKLEPTNDTVFKHSLYVDLPPLMHHWQAITHDVFIAVFDGSSNLTDVTARRFVRCGVCIRPHRITFYRWMRRISPVVMRLQADSTVINTCVAEIFSDVAILRAETHATAVGLVWTVAPELIIFKIAADVEASAPSS